MEYISYSHRFADAIIAADSELRRRYNEFVGAISGISDEELIADFERRKAEHAQRGTSFKSLTPSINGILKERMLQLPGWQADVDIFNDETGAIGNTEWRLDFACDDAFCVEVAFNHGEAIAWNLLKPVLSCELNHVQKAVQGKLGIYVCATDAMKVAANIDSASGSYEKVLRYLPPMMNQLTVPMMIIGLQPFKSFKITEDAGVIRSLHTLDDRWVGKRVLVTLNDYSTFKGTAIRFISAADADDGIEKIVVQKSRRDIRDIGLNNIRFIEEK